MILLRGKSTSPFSIFAIEDLLVYPVFFASSSCDRPLSSRSCLIFLYKSIISVPTFRIQYSMCVKIFQHNCEKMLTQNSQRWYSMNVNKHKPALKRLKRGGEVMKKECDGFFEAYGITPAQEELFEAIYRRRQIYRRIIGALALVIAILIVLLCLK